MRMTGRTVPGPAGAPCWTGLLVRSLPAAEEFYGALFGWEFRPGPAHFGRYVRAVRGGRLVAGMGETPYGHGQPAAWTTYLSTADADAAAGAIRVCGGTVAVGPLDAENEAGRIAVAADPSGAAFGVWQPMGHTGFEVAGEPGTLAWNELVTGEPAAAAKFYAAAFGFAPDAPVPADPGARQDGGGDHVTLRLNGEPVAGIRGAGARWPGRRGAHWTTYFEVADADEAAARVGELGGRILREPHEEVTGRVAEVADPQGAAFAVVRTNR
jgi:uncharacterized protein